MLENLDITIQVSLETLVLRQCALRNQDWSLLKFTYIVLCVLCFWTEVWLTRKGGGLRWRIIQEHFKVNELGEQFNGKIDNSRTDPSGDNENTTIWNTKKRRLTHLYSTQETYTVVLHIIIRKNTRTSDCFCQ